MTKTFVAGLQASTQTSYVNNGKTTMLGRAFQKTLNSLSVIGPPLTQFIDVQTLAGFVPSYSYFNPSTNRLYVLGPVSATPTVALFSFNNSTGAYSYIGKIIMSLGNAAATTYVFRGFKVYESGGLIYPIISATGSVAVNGGNYVAWGLSASDFTFGGTTIFAANTSNQKAVYFMQDPAAPGVGNVTTTSWGIVLPQFSSNSAVNTKVYQFNGTLATPVVYSWDLANTPSVANTVTSGVSSQTTLFANTTPSAFFTMSAQNGYVATAGEQVVLMNGTGNVPTAFTAWAAGTAQVAATNIYFMRDFQQLYTFTCTALTTGISAGSTYTNNGFTFTVLTAASASATTFVASVPPPGAPVASGTLTRTAGTGDATITFSVNVAGSYYFNLGTTSGGAAVTPTSTTSSFTMMRAFGITTALFNFKTGTLPAFTLGAILQNQSVGYAKPTSAPANTALNGQDCLYMSSTTGLYMGKISDLTSLGTTWASMTSTGVNITGTAIDIVAPTVISATYSGQNQANEIDRWVYVTSASSYVIKPYQASNISAVFGGQSNSYLETLGLTTVQAGVLTPTVADIVNGWMFICSSTIGQRGIVFCDIGSTASLGNSQVISPVLNLPVGSTLKYINTLEQIFESTNSLNISIRSATTSGDSIFSSATSGWSQISIAQDLSGTAVGPYFQLMATYNIVANNSSTPAQINDFVYSVILGNDISDNWAGSGNNTTQNGASPSYSAFRLTTAYTSTVPTMYFRAYDDSGNLVASANTASNPTLFQYSTNNGTSWSALGTIPNTILTTEVRYLWASPPGVSATVSFKES